jgi:hypothetical protein
MFIFDTNFYILISQIYFEDIITDSINIIFLISEQDINTNNLPSIISEKCFDL